MIWTIESDDDVSLHSESEDESKEQSKGGNKSSKASNKRKRRGGKVDEDTAGFSFEYNDGTIDHELDSSGDSDNSDAGSGSDSENSGSESGSGDDGDSVSAGEEEEEEYDADGTKVMSRAEERAIRAAAKKESKREERERNGGKDEDEENDGMNSDEENDYFDSIVESGANAGDVTMFSQLNLSRPLLRAVDAAGYTAPTAVQAKVIPYALAGRDVCASAVTGSGKTAAFALPFIERLLFRPKDQAAIRVLVVTPTRELATQIHEVIQKLARFTDITCCLICGGKKDIKSQTVLLRQRPDIVVGTPGRIIDHLRNSASVNLQDLDVLVLDEVDRLLDLGFQAELEELVKHCPHGRQTLLFSATMTAKVEDLVKLSLRKPVRVKASGGPTTIAPRLVQEFVRVREEEEREAQLACLLCKSFKGEGRTIVFFETKKAAHRFCAVLNILGVKAVELHGDLPQLQRDLAVQKFRDHEVDVLIATDVAARGLDVQGVRLVINAEMPRSVSTYVHRVGRTARAGTSGRALTLVSDARRKVMKNLLKGEGGLLSADAAQVLTRTIPANTITQFRNKIDGLEADLEDAFREERVTTKLEIAIREAERAQNLLLHEDEISARPNRTWYQTETQKNEVKTATKILARKEEKEAEVGRKEAARLEMTATQKAMAMARADDYRREEAAAKKEHRLSRKKRRRLEALRDMAQNPDEAGAAVEGGEAQETKMPTQASFGSAKRQVKEDERQAQKERGGGMFLEDDKQKLRNQNRTASRPKFAIGGLDTDDVWGRKKSDAKPSKSAAKTLREAAEFTEFDASKALRKGGKIGTSSFKSKKKFKRR